MMLFYEDENTEEESCDNCRFWTRVGVIKGKCENPDSICYNSKTYDDDCCDDYERNEE